MSEVACVAQCMSGVQAHPMVAALDAAGIAAEVWGGDSPVMGMAGWGGVRVVVAADEAEKARAVLAETAEEGRRDEPPISEDELARQAAEAAPGSPEAEPHPDEEEDFVDVVADKVLEGERYARTTRTIAIVGVFVALLSIATVVRVTSPPAGMFFSSRALRHMRQARILLYVSIGVAAVAVAARVFLRPS